MANSPRLVIACVHSCSSSPLSIHARCRPVVVRACCGLWVMVKGVGGRCCLYAVVMVVITCVPSWVLGISCGRWQLIVVVLGWGGGLFLGGGHHFSWAVHVLTVK